MAQFIGRVVGTKMQKTAKVEVIRLQLHPLVLKVSYANYYNECHSLAPVARCDCYTSRCIHTVLNCSVS